MIEKWKRCYALGEHICIDEAMLNWRGRLNIKVYIKNKPVSHGIKSYVLADSKTYYCWNLYVYHKEKRSLKETVCGLLTPACFGLWHSLYMDNFYNSVALSEALLEKKVHTVGTLRGNRGEPPELKRRSAMAQHDVNAMDNGKVVVMAWKDKRVVKAITTKHDASKCTIHRRKRGGQGQIEAVQKPSAIDDYNKHMSGVDILDQMLSYYPCTKKP